MRTLKGRFALLAGSSAALVILATCALLWGLYATETALEGTLTAQSRLHRLEDLSGRLSDYGLAAVDAVGAADRRSERMQAASAAVGSAIERVETGYAGAGTDRVLTEARWRQLARIKAALGLLDGQIAGALAQAQPDRRADAVRGAFNVFGAMTGPALSALVDSERRGVEAASEDAHALIRRLRIAAVIAALGSLALVLGTHRAITRPLLRRIAAIRAGAAAIGKGDLDTRLPVTVRDEFGLAVAGFNRMAARLARRERRISADRAALEKIVTERTRDLTAANDRLAAIDQSRRRFFTDVSHELRTPLTVILAECDVGLRAPLRDPESQREMLGTIRKRALRLHRRVEDLLRVARSESGQIELDLKPVSLIDVATEAVESLRNEARRHAIALKLDPGTADAEVQADAEWLRQVIEGLIDNAIRHAAGATQVTVALSQTETGAEITVCDDGSGFPEAGETLFERFARARGTGGAPGFGVGLALARWVVERHHGRIALERGENGRGTRIRISLAAQRDRDAA